MAIHYFPSAGTLTPTGTFSDPGMVNLGTAFGLTAAANITGVRFYAPTTTTSATIQLWDDGVKIAEKTGVTMTGPGWTTTSFDTPVAGDTSSLYIVSVYWPVGATAQYSTRSLTFSDGTNPVLVSVGPVFSNTTENGLYIYNSTAIPSTPSGTNGVWFGVDAVVDDLASGNASVTAVAATGSGLLCVPTVTGTSPGQVAAVTATGSGLFHAPVVTGSSNGSVTAVRAQGSGLLEAPGVSGSMVLSGGSPAAGSGLMRAPAVSANGNATVSAVAATGSGMGRSPVVPASIAAIVASGQGLLPAPVVSGGTFSGSVTAVKAQGSGLAGIPGVQVVETLPSNTGTGRITARFATAEVLVGDNDGIPNIFPITTATITFTSTASVLLNVTATPAPIVIMPKPIVCTLDSQGYMVDSAGHRWCDLIATDDVDLTPSSRKWRVTFSGISIGEFTIAVAGGTTVDLTSLIPT